MKNLLFLALVGLALISSQAEEQAPEAPIAPNTTAEIDEKPEGALDMLIDEDEQDNNVTETEEVNEHLTFDCSLSQFDTEEKLKDFFSCNEFQNNGDLFTTHCCLDDDVSLASYCEFSYLGKFESQRWQGVIEPDFEHIEKMNMFAPACTQKFHSCLFVNKDLAVVKTERFQDSSCTELDMYGAEQEVQTRAFVKKEEWAECGKTPNCVELSQTSIKKSCVGYSGPSMEGNMTEIFPAGEAPVIDPPEDDLEMTTTTKQPAKVVTSKPSEFDPSGKYGKTKEQKVAGSTSPQEGKDTTASVEKDGSGTAQIVVKETTGVPVWSLPVVGVGSALVAAVITALIFNRKSDHGVVQTNYQEFENIGSLDDATDSDNN